MPWSTFFQLAAFGFYTLFCLVVGAWVMLLGGAGRSPFQGVSTAIASVKTIFRRTSDNGQGQRASVEPRVTS